MQEKARMRPGLAAAIWTALCATMMGAGMTMGAGALAQPAGGAGGQGMMGRLMAADANHDGAISKAEARSAREAMFARLDANKDGFLTSDETARGDGQKGGRGGRGGQRGGGGDANGDGKVSREEFLNGRYRAFDMFDANHDDVLEASEIQTAQNLFAQRRAGTP